MYLDIQVPYLFVSQIKERELALTIGMRLKMSSIQFLVLPWGKFEPTVVQGQQKISKKSSYSNNKSFSSSTQFSSSKESDSSIHSKYRY